MIFPVVGGRMRKAGLILFVLFLAVLSFAQDEPKDEPKHPPSTAAERQRFLALTRKLEQNPLDKSLYSEKTWAKKWLEDIPDINVNICAPILFGMDFVTEQNKYTPRGQFFANPFVFLFFFLLVCCNVRRVFRF